jgi:transposase-like protein
MVRHGQQQKHQEWQERLARFQQCGLTVARFCQQEQIAPHVFYYWARRLRSGAAQAPVMKQHRSRSAAEVLPPPATAAAVVRFRLESGVEVSLPAHCLDAIRCLAESLGSRRTAALPAFQQVQVRQG